jgi:hypothetical protein
MMAAAATVTTHHNPCNSSAAETTENLNPQQWQNICSLGFVCLMEGPEQSHESFRDHGHLSFFFDQSLKTRMLFIDCSSSVCGMSETKKG